MWQPTAYKVIGKIVTKPGFFFGSDGILICRSHTGKVFRIEGVDPYYVEYNVQVGDAGFCNGDFCRLMPSYEAAKKRLEEVIHTSQEE